MASFRLALILLPVAMGFSRSQSSRVLSQHVAKSPAIRMEFGDHFYVSHDSPAPFGPTSEDPTLPKGVFECYLKRPLGIQFEEQDTRGVMVLSLVSGGNAELSSKIQAGDVLVGVTAVCAQPGVYTHNRADCTRAIMVGDPFARIRRATHLTRVRVRARAVQIKLKGAKFERQMFDCRRWTFDMVVDAIGSNDPERFGCEDVVLQFSRPGELEARLD